MTSHGPLKALRRLAGPALAAGALLLAMPALAQQKATDWGWPQPYEKISDKSVQWLKDKGWWPLQIAFQPPWSGQNTINIVMDKQGLLAKRGIEAKLQAFPSGPAINEVMISGRFQVGNGGNFPFTSLIDKNIPVKAIAVINVNLMHALVVPNDSPLKSVKDLKGRTFAFVDPSSTSGHLFPKAGLMKAGFDPDKDFGRVIFSGSHDSSAIAVQNRKVDAAAIADRILDAAVAKGLVKREDLVEVWRSEPIPESPTVWRKDLGADLKQRVQAAFLQVKDIPWSDQGLLNGFHPTNDAAYNVIRDTAKILKLDLGKMK